MEHLDEILKLIDFTEIETNKLCFLSNNAIARESKTFLELVIESYQFQLEPTSLQQSPFSKLNTKKLKKRKKDFEIFFEDYDKNKVSVEKIKKSTFKIKRINGESWDCNLRTNKISNLNRKIFYAKVTSLNKNGHEYSHFSGVQNISQYNVSALNFYNNGINFLNRASSQIYGKGVSNSNCDVKADNNGDSFLMEVDFEKDKITFEDKNGKNWSDTLSKYVDTSFCCFSFSHCKLNSEYQVEFSNKRIEF